MVFRRKRSFRPKRRSFKRKPRSKPARAGKKMQRMSLSFVKKKYTTVIPLKCPSGSQSVELTISHIGGRNSTTPNATYTITNADPDGMLATDMTLYQFFKISGVSFKIMFPEGTEAVNTPV